MSDQLPDSVIIDVALVRRLVAAQFPEYAQLPIRPVAQSGWDNRTFHLGDELSVRLPSGEGYVRQVEKEQHWLPILGPQLPLPIPTPVGKGDPNADFPWPWSIYRWLPGETVHSQPQTDLNQLALDLAGFLLALQGLDTTDAPRPGKTYHLRGGPIAPLDNPARDGIADLPSHYDKTALSAIWAKCLESTFAGPGVWAHGDVAPGNLLLHDGRLCAVIDFGLLVAGDPACDLVIAWTCFDADSRQLFRQRLGVDAGTWARGKAWALWKAAIVESGHIQSSVIETEVAPRVLRELLLDAEQHS